MAEILQKVYRLEGMHCEDCVNRVRRQLESLPGVTMANVSLAERKAWIAMVPDGPTDAQIQRVLSDAGYTAQPATE